MAESSLCWGDCLPVPTCPGRGHVFGQEETDQKYFVLSSERRRLL